MALCTPLAAGRDDALLTAEPGQHAGDRQADRRPAEKRSEFCLLEEVAVLSLDMPKCFVRSHCFREMS